MVRGRTYDSLKILIENGKYKDKEDMMFKLDIFLLGDRITASEYNELVALLETREL